MSDILKFEFTKQEAQQLIDGAQYLPFKDASPLINKIVHQANNQPAPEVAPAIDRTIVRAEDIAPVPETTKPVNAAGKVSKKIKEVLDKLDPLPDVAGLKQVFPDLKESTLKVQLSNYKKATGR